MTSFCMQFEKIGRGLLREAFRSEELFTRSTPMFTSVFQDQYSFFPSRAFNKKPTLPLSGKLPTVTHTLFFQTAYKMTSRWCIVAWSIYTKKQSYTTGCSVFGSSVYYKIEILSVSCTFQNILNLVGLTKLIEMRKGIF